MYLEISGRQTGKTTRLINQIYADKNKYDLQVLLGINWNSLKNIKSQITQNRKLKVCLSYDSFKATILGYKNIRLYVDEFLYSTTFCNNFEEFKKYYLDLIKNGYFSSSVCTPVDRYTVFFDLKELNDGLVTSMYTTTNFFI